MIYPFPTFTYWRKINHVIPKLYWDAYSQEQLLKELEETYSGISTYTDALTAKLNEVIEIVNAMESQLPDLVIDAIKKDDEIKASIEGYIKKYMQDLLTGETYGTIKEHGYLYDINKEI